MLLALSGKAVKQRWHATGAEKYVKKWPVGLFCKVSGPLFYLLLPSSKFSLGHRVFTTGCCCLVANFVQ